MELINRRLDAVAALIDDWALRERIRQVLKGTPDMSRALSRLKLKRGGPRDLGGLRDGLIAAENLSEMLSTATALPPELQEIAQAARAVASCGKAPSPRPSPKGRGGRLRPRH